MCMCVLVCVCGGGGVARKSEVEAYIGFIADYSTWRLYLENVCRAIHFICVSVKDSDARARLEVEVYIGFMADYSTWRLYLEAL
jgi:hypothetical protein